MVPGAGHSFLTLLELLKTGRDTVIGETVFAAPFSKQDPTPAGTASEYACRSKKGLLQTADLWSICDLEIVCARNQESGGAD